jgi:hypothetical protein
MKCKWSACNNEVAGKQKTQLFCRPRCKDHYHTDKRRWENKLKAIVEKGGKCQVCGYDKCPTALEFHHLNPEEKSFSIGGNAKFKRWKQIQEEIKKCDLLCANCHREAEFVKTSQHKTILVELCSKYNFKIELSKQG